MFGEQLGPILMFLLGISLLTSILLRKSYGQIGRRRKAYDSRPIDAQPRPKTEWDGAKHDSIAVIEREKVQLAQMSRDVNGQLDTKIMILRDLLARSEEQIDRLEELLGETQNA